MTGIFGPIILARNYFVILNIDESFAATISFLTHLAMSINENSLSTRIHEATTAYYCVLHYCKCG